MAEVPWAKGEPGEIAERPPARHYPQTGGGIRSDAAGGSVIPPSDDGACVPSGPGPAALEAHAPSSPPSFEQLLAAPHEQFDVKSEVTPYLLAMLGVPPQSRTVAAPLCDPDGVVRSGAMHHGTDYQCTGSAHFDGVYIRCTSPAHTPTAGGEVQPGGTPPGAGTPDAATAAPAPSSPHTVQRPVPKPMCAACEADMEAPMCNACCTYSRSLEVARNIVNQLADLWNVPVDTRQATNDQADAFVADLISERLDAPPVRPLALHRERVIDVIAAHLWDPEESDNCPCGYDFAGRPPVEHLADAVLATAVDLDSIEVLERIEWEMRGHDCADIVRQNIPHLALAAVAALRDLAGGEQR